MAEQVVNEEVVIDELRYDNPLGFTREIAGLLTGLGITNLAEFKKKEINLDDLKNLTDEDLKILGVDDNFNRSQYKYMVANLRKKYKENQPSVEEVLQILSSGNRQLKVICVILNYLNEKKLCNLDIQDFFINKNKNLKASQVLIEEVEYLFKEIKELEEVSNNIQSIKEVKTRSNYKFSFLVGGVSIILLVCLYNRIYN